MTPKERAAMKLALDALEYVNKGMVECYVETGFDFANERYEADEAIAALRQAISEAELTEQNISDHKSEQAEQEPVAYLCNGTRYKVIGGSSYGAIMGLPERLVGQWVALVDATDSKHLKYTAPPQREWSDRAVQIQALQAIGAEWYDGKIRNQWIADTCHELTKVIAGGKAPQREWVSLTDDEKFKLQFNFPRTSLAAVEAIESALRRKNEQV